MAQLRPDRLANQDQDQDVPFGHDS